MPSSTTANAPASCTARASSSTRCAPSSERPCTRWPPIRWIACGVSPTWPITGISAVTMRSIVAAIATPPSSFTAWAPPSFTQRTALRSASSGEIWNVPNGMSATTSAR